MQLMFHNMYMFYILFIYPIYLIFQEKHGKRHSIEKSPENEAYTVMVLDEELGPQTNTALPIPRLYPEIPREVPSAPPVTIQHAGEVFIFLSDH